MKLKITLFVSAIMLINTCIYSQDHSETSKLTGLEQADGAHLGESVAISGNYAIAGADLDSGDESGNNYVYTAGTAYIFERDINGNWSEGQKIVASDRGAADHFGISVGISGNYAIVGALHEDEDALGENTMSAAGSAYIFKRNENGIWKEVQKIVASDRDESDFFGRSVDISGNHAIIGAYAEDEDTSGLFTVADAGSAYIFEKDENGTWNEIKKIVASDRAEYDRFGEVVAISDDYAIVGVPDEDEDANGENTYGAAGSAYIFECDDRGYWNKVQKIVASDRAEGDFFGKSVSISGSKAIVAAYANDEESGGSIFYDAGSAYIFERDESGNWIEVDKIIASDIGTGDGFGNSVSISENYAVVGSSFDGENAQREDTISYAGSAYIFKRNGSENWDEVQKIVSSDRDTSDFFGSAVGISGDYIICGAVNDDLEDKKSEPIGEHGSAYIFETCSQNPENNPENIIENGDFEICKINPWSLAAWEGATASAVLVNGECVVMPLDIASDPLPWHIQLMQVFSANQIDRLDEDEIYTISFDAYAEATDRHCYVFFGEHFPPFTALIDEKFTVGTDPESFSFEFNLSSVFSDMRLALSIGAETPAVTFDNVRLIKKVLPSGIVGISDNNKIKIMPNPATDHFQVFAEEGSVVSIYNSLGQIIKTGTIENEQITFQIDEFAGGIYIIKVHKKNKVYTSKIMLR